MDYIQLLDGERFRKDELLELMKDDEFYYGYLGKPLDRDWETKS